MLRTHRLIAQGVAKSLWTSAPTCGCIVAEVGFLNLGEGHVVCRAQSPPRRLRGTVST